MCYGMNCVSPLSQIHVEALTPNVIGDRAFRRHLRLNEANRSEVLI